MFLSRYKTGILKIEKADGNEAVLDDKRSNEKMDNRGKAELIESTAHNESAAHSESMEHNESAAARNVKTACYMKSDSEHNAECSKAKKFNLPDGQEFHYWEDKTKYRRTIHVAQQNPAASDNNEGSEGSPYKTISRAVETAGPGDMVLIHEGVYHETIRPLKGGCSENEMLYFHGVDKEKVIVTGAEIYNGEYTVSEGWMPNYPGGEYNRFSEPEAKVYALSLPRSAFNGVNPFSMINTPVLPWYFSGESVSYGWGISTIFNIPKEDARQKKTVIKRRGLVFCDGKRLEQVLNFFELGSVKGAFFVEDDGLILHLRLPDDSDPENHIIEYTAREQTFCPEKKYTGYVRIDNISFIKAGNGFPPPQRGSVSTNCGHHYIIENCIIDEANGIGIDIGFQAPFRLSDAARGYHRVCCCIISNCGISGISGVCGSSSTTKYIDMQHSSILIMGNRFYNNCWHYFPSMCEEAAVKIHHAKDSLCVDNYVYKTGSYGIWMDASHMNSAVRGNVIVDTSLSGVYFEASHDYLEVSYNIVINAGTDGLLSYCCDEISYTGNLILNSCMFGINNRLQPDRINVGRGNTGFGINYYQNIISSCRYALMQPMDRNKADRNIYGSFEEGGYLKVGFPELHLDLKAWQKYMGWDLKGCVAAIGYELIQDGGKTELRLSISTEKGKVEAKIDLNVPVRSQIEQLLAMVESEGITG